MTRTSAVVIAALVALVPAAASRASAAQRFSGKIVKIDMALGKVTITHGAIPQLDMPSGMTMGYRVENKAMLDGLKVGERVGFDARDDGGSYTITEIKGK